MGDFFEFALDQRLRGHDYKTQKESFKGVVRQSFLTNRTFTLWDGLSPETVNVSTVHAFKILRYWTEINLHLRLKLSFLRYRFILRKYSFLNNNNNNNNI
jgi:hypothetical protein